jgi:protein involved in polysaccharide export with SLBB domain
MLHLGFRVFVMLCAIFITYTIHAQSLPNISQAQLSQFKNLTREQQEALAKQAGVDVSALLGNQQRTNQSLPFQPDFQSGQFPRGTEFDEFGQPVEVDPVEQFLRVEEEELKPFGYELFANAPSTVSPTYDTPVPADYYLGPGDSITLQMYGKENVSYELLVDREGKVTIPELGPVVVNGLTFSEVKALLSNRVKQQIIGAEVSISMGALRSIRIFVLGEAFKPGAYTISSLSTMTHAIIASGGLSDIASLRNIQLKRAGKLITTLDLYDLMIKGDNSQDRILQAGDVVLIPAIGSSVSVSGKVRRPAIYELKDETTLNEVMTLAGGILPDGYSAGIGVTRYSNAGKIQLTLDLGVSSGIKNGDEIVVPSISGFVSDSVTLIGAVSRPGRYQIKPQMSLLDLLGNRTQDLLPDADLDYALVVRNRDLSGDVDVYQFDLNELYQGASSPLQLQKNDRVIVFSKNESESLVTSTLDDLALTSDETDKRDKTQLQDIINEKLFWERLGVVDEEGEIDLFADEEPEELVSTALITLTESERDQLIRYRDNANFSRNRLLLPLMEQLREQSGSGRPLQLVEIAGAVKYPGIYPLPVNGSVKHIIKAAGGLSESAYGAKSEITQTVLGIDGKATINHIGFSPAGVMQGNETVALTSKDRINIFNVPDWQEELKVVLEGEFTFPGEYTIERGESLSELIERAGGLTSFANPTASVFTRESLKIQEENNIRKLAEELRKEVASQSLRKNSSGLVSYADARVLLRDLSRVQAVGRLVLEVDEIVTGNKNLDINLQDGDRLYIPSVNRTVNVIGEVYQPTSHVFDESLGFQEYVQTSGGYRNLAAVDKVYIIRANGSVVTPSKTKKFWFSGGQSKFSVQPGDTIVVPFDSGHVDNLTLWTNVSQVLYQFAVTIAAVGSL